MNKKIWIILSAIAILLLGAWYFTRNQAKPALETTPAQQTVTDEFGELIYDRATSEVKKYSSQTQGYLPTAKLNEQPYYLELSPDEKNLMYSTFAANESLETDFAELSVKGVDRNQAIATIPNTFSPRWLDENRIIYQNVDFEFVIYSIDSKTSSKTGVKTEDLYDISVLSDQKIAISAYSTDIGRSTAKLVDLGQSSLSDLFTANGLSLKTLKDSKIIGYQSVDSETVTSTLVNYETKKIVFSVKQPIGNVAWNQDASKIFYQENDALISMDSVTNTKTTLLARLEGRLNLLEALSGNRLLVKTANSTQILEIQP